MLEKTLDYAAENEILQIVLVVLVILVCVAVAMVGAWKKKIKPMLSDYVKSQKQKEQDALSKEAHEKTISEMRCQFETIVQTVEQGMTEMKSMIDNINNYNKKQTEVIKDQLKHSILRACEDYLFKQCVKANELSSLLDMYNQYHSEPIDGNTFVHERVTLVCMLPIVKDGTESYLHEKLFHFLEEEGINFREVKYIEESEVKGWTI